MTERTWSRRQLLTMTIVHPIGMLLGAVVGCLAAYAVVRGLEGLHPGFLEAYGFRDFNKLGVVVLWCFFGAFVGSAIIGAMATVWVLQHTDKPLTRRAGWIMFVLDLVTWGLFTMLLMTSRLHTAMIPLFIGVFVVAVPALALRFTEDGADTAS